MSLSRRSLAIATLALFGHAVVLHLLHSHGLPSNAHAAATSVAISSPNDAPAGQQQSGENCPACQLQHGFVFLAALPAVASLGDTTDGGSEIVPPFTAQRRAEASTPSRAPPTL